jgi:hypothetical protein
MSKENQVCLFSYGISIPDHYWNYIVQQYAKKSEESKSFPGIDEDQSPKLKNKKAKISTSIISYDGEEIPGIEAIGSLLRLSEQKSDTTMHSSSYFPSINHELGKHVDAQSILTAIVGQLPDKLKIRWFTDSSQNCTFLYFASLGITISKGFTGIKKLNEEQNSTLSIEYQRAADFIIQELGLDTNPIDYERERNNGPYTSLHQVTFQWGIFSGEVRNFLSSSCFPLFPPFCFVLLLLLSLFVL